MFSGKSFSAVFQKAALLVVAASVPFASVFSSDAQANSRYANKPPVILSPDLTEPWQLQITPDRKARVVVRSNKSRAFIRNDRNRQKANKKRTQQAAVSRHTARSRELPARFLPQIVEYNTTQKPGTIVIDTKTKFLYLVMGNGEAKRYGVGVGKEGFGWTGTERVTRKAEWPSWRPPLEMIKREAAKGRQLPRFMPGGPENPMGARGIYLGSTLYRIHGTNAPWTIGQAVSSGCFRMRNEDVMDLYPHVQLGAKVVVI